MESKQSQATFSHAASKAPKHKKKHKWAKWLTTTLIALATLAVALLAYLNDHYPWIFDSNQSYEEMAKKGHVESQMHQAQIDFDAGNYSDALRWYEMASEKEGKYQAVACNNLGYLYATRYGLADEEGRNDYYNEKAYQLFRKAGLLGQNEGAANGVALLLKNGRESFPNVDEKEIAEFLYSFHYSQTKSIEYKKFPTYQGTCFWVGNTYYKYSGSETCPETRLTTRGEVETGRTRTVYTYFMETYKSDEDIPEYQYIHLDFNDS